MDIGRRFAVREQLSESDFTELLRVVTNQPGGRPALLRRVKPGCPSDEGVAALRNEYELTQRHALRCMLEPVAFLDRGAETAILYRDVDGMPLQRWRPADRTRELLAGVERIWAALAEVHSAGMLHRDLRPSHLWIAHDRVLITDFARARLRPRDYGEIGHPGRIGRDLRYVAPEQTGRMTCPADARADYYSFGIILYELLTGAPPFTSDDPLELIYQHLAVAPVAPDEIDPTIGRFLSRIVVKLLAKAPDQRYQSSEGLLADLRLAANPADAERAAVGGHDVPWEIKAPHRLYGRESERTVLLDSFERACRGSREMVLIAGYSGIGKTALIRETYLPVTRQRALFVSGKFDQLRRQVPYSAWVEALGRLVSYVLAEPESALRSWQMRLTAALGRNAGLLIELIPGLTTLIGPRPAPPDLPPGEALRRFLEVFRAFIQVFCQPGRPLVIFLDDLQWIDASSLKLLELLAGEGGCDDLFLIGAYRDNEVPVTHPLMIAQAELKRANAIHIRQIVLQPLTAGDVAAIIADTFALAPEAAAALAGVIDRRSGGNPFFLWQLLRTLRARHLIAFDPEAMLWRWNQAELAQLAYTDNVVDLLAQRFHALPEPARRCLAWGACLGSRFDLALIATLVEVPVAEAAAMLAPALQEEFILPETTGDQQGATAGFRFLHDRMQEAAYRSIPAEARAAAHHRIARRLITDTPAAQLPDRIFAIADHLNLSGLLSGPGPGNTGGVDPLERARLNLMAGCKARDSAAYAAALSYLEAGMAGLPDDLWATDHALARALHRHRGEFAYLNSRFDEAEYFVQQAIDHEIDLISKAELTHLLVVQYTLRALYQKAIDTARAGLRLFGVDLPEQNFAAVRDAELATVRTLLGARPLAALAELPPMTNDRARAVMMLLTSMGPPCYRAHPRLWGVIVALEVRLCLEHGSVPSASYTYPAFGGLLTHVGAGGGPECAALTRVTLADIERFRAPADTSVGHLMIGSSLRHWFAPLVEASRDYRNAFQVGVESGNLQYAVYGFGHNAYCRFFQGVPLGELVVDVEGYLAFSRQRGNLWGIDLTEGVLRVIARLRGTADPDGAAEQAWLDGCAGHGNLQVLCLYHILNAEAAIHLGRFDVAAGNLAEAALRLDSVSTQGLLPVTQYYFLRAVVLAVQPAALGVTAGAAAVELAEIGRRFRRWAADCPANFAHAAWLVAAEEARLAGDLATALDAYDQALEAAQGQGFVQRVGLIASRAAAFWDGCARPRFARLYTEQARSAYAAWQAAAIPGLRPDRGPAAAVSPGGLSSRSHDILALDFQSVIETARALSTHVSSDDLVQSIIATVERMSGAQRIVLLLTMGQRLILVVDTRLRRVAGEDVTTRDLAAVDTLPQRVIQYVARTQQSLRIDRARIDEAPVTAEDPYLRTAPMRTGLCLPLVFLGRTEGILYMEHQDADDAFHPDNRPILEFIAAQAAISCRNADLFQRLEREIEEHRQADEEIRRLNADLEVRVAERTAALTIANQELEAFTYAVSHDLRAPLRALEGFSSALVEDYGDRLDGEARLYLDQITVASRHMSALIDALLHMSRTARGELCRQAVDLSALAERLRTEIEQSEPGRTVTWRIAAGLMVDADPLMIEVVMRNLLSNAWKYTARTGNPVIEVGSRVEGGRTWITVVDNGAGFDMAHAGKLFKIFQRLHRQDEFTGIGIGLATVQRIIRRHGGEIRATGVPNQGAAFQFSL